MNNRGQIEYFRDEVLTQVINLDGSADRLAAISGQLAAASLEFSRFAAVDARARDLAEFPDYDSIGARFVLARPMTGGEVGCYQSHLECARNFLATGCRFGLVLEDDALVTPDSVKRLAECLECLDLLPSWDIVNLGHAPKRFYHIVEGGSTAGLCRAYYFPITTTALLWSREGARRFVRDHGRMSVPVDIELRNMVGATGRGLAMRPALFPPSNNVSTIDVGVRIRADKNRTLGYRLSTISRRIRENFDAASGWVQHRNSAL